jgi:hypothetical protein
MSAAPLPVPTAPIPAATEHHLRTARRVFQGALLWTCGLTVFWGAMMVLGPEKAPIFGRYRIDKQALGAVLFGFLFFNVIWGAIWWGIRYALLRQFVEMSKDDVREIFTSRMHHPFDLARYLGRYSERRIRITDMIGRRGRFLTLALMGFLYIYGRVAVDPKPEYLVFGAGDSLFDAMIACWVFLAFYYSDGFLGWMVYGAQARLMDGTLGRANCLLISMLWSAFKFIFVPLSLRLAAHFPPATFAPLFAFIWVSYLAADACAEIAGSLFGKQKLKVWGMGEVNRKSVEGTVAGFVASLAVCLAVVFARDLPLPWVGLAVVVSVSNTLLELFSPRGTDDFTMATANALLCLGFGILVY